MLLAGMMLIVRVTEPTGVYAGMARRAGRPIGFTTYLKVGIPATLVSMVLATGYIALRYL